MAKSFKGIAYWKGDSLKEGWLDEALEALRPIIEPSGLSVQVDTATPSRPLVVTKPQGSAPPVELLSLVVSGGSTQGMVMEGPDAGVTLLLLMALRRKPGGIVLVDDKTETIPSRFSETYPPFVSVRERIRALAGPLGLAADEAFRERPPAIFARVL